MILYPAIDLRGGKVVRLTGGDYDRMSVYASDPVFAAESFQSQGATHLHMVDLDGARDGSQQNIRVVERICARCNLFVEVGGGARDEASVLRYLDAGAGRVILGTLAVTDPKLTENLARKHPGRIAVGIDARDGLVAIRGWRELTDIRGMEFARRLPKMGVSCTIYTDISRDGMMKGANLDVYRELAGIEALDVIASGGVTTLKDVRALTRMGLHGAIIGKALYEGKIDLVRALQVAEGKK